ncbi:MAG TPA: ornithine acetyltransferase, partial [Sediminispirochaeta sp.]|nr:ornithine acetyltransferase [Sediminispirochaeta sp.]
MESIQTPKGFLAQGFHGAVKKRGLDTAILHSTHPVSSAGMLTSNRVRAACVDWNRELLGQDVRGILINSGNANACTGSRGQEDSLRLAQTLARCLESDPKKIFLASTGVIGVPLPIDDMCRAIEKHCKPQQSPTAFADAAEAIMTTDTVPKMASFEFHHSGRTA